MTLRAMLLAIGLGAAALTAAVPAEARYRDRSYGYERGHGRHYGHDRGRRAYGYAGRRYGYRGHHGRNRYSYYRDGRRYGGWR